MPDADIQFLRVTQVAAMIGLSKSEIYRQIDAGRFPASRSYPDSPRRRFWLRSDVARWQRDVIAATGGDEYEDLVG